MLDARYTDEDVRGDDYLVQLAYSHLRNYVGDFPFLVKAKNYLEEYGELPAPTVRGVLNCMRADPAAAMRLPRRELGTMSRAAPSRRRSLVAVPPRPTYVVVKTTWKLPYLLSTHKLAEVYHVLRIDWYTHLGVFVAKLHTWCGARYDSGGSYILSKDTQGRRVCKACHRVLEARQEREI